MIRSILPFKATSLLLGMLTLILFVSFSGCSTLQQQDRLQREQDLAQRAVKELLLIALPRIQSYKTPETWISASSSSLIPAGAGTIVQNLKVIPGLSGYINHYLEIARQLLEAAIKESLSEMIDLASSATFTNPLQIVRGSSNEATMAFTAINEDRFAPMFETYFKEHVELHDSWSAIIRQYNLYAETKNQLASLTDSEEIETLDIPIIDHIVGISINQFTSTLALQEVYIRSKAGSYDSAPEQMFATSGRP